MLLIVIVYITVVIVAIIVVRDYYAAIGCVCTKAIRRVSHACVSNAKSRIRRVLTRQLVFFANIFECVVNARFIVLVRVIILR